LASAHEAAEPFGQGGFADAGQIFQEQVPFGQQDGHGPLDLGLLADDDAAEGFDAGAGASPKGFG
jgi:hypothetical protein